MRRMKLGVKLSERMNYSELEGILDTENDDQELFKLIVNAPFSYKVSTVMMSLGIIVLLLADKKSGTINRIAISDNDLAKRTKYRSAKRFEDIKIPLKHDTNIISKAISTGKPQGTGDWEYLFVPELSAQDARF